MKTAIKANRSAALVGAAALAVAAMGFAGAAQARDNVYWSVGVGSPGVAMNVGNAYPVYVEPQPVYIQPAPVYYQPQPVYVQPASVYYGRPGWRGRYNGYYAPVYYRRGGEHGHQHGDRDDD